MRELRIEPGMNADGSIYCLVVFCVNYKLCSQMASISLYRLYGSSLEYQLNLNSWIMRHVGAETKAVCPQCKGKEYATNGK